MPLTFSIVSFSIAAGILIALYVVRSYRKALEKERANDDAREFMDAELRRPR